MRQIVLITLAAALISTGPVAAAETTLAPAGGASHLLVDGEKAVATIVLPREPDELESHAAAELQKYVEAITGRELRIVNEPQVPSGYGVWLGETEAAGSTDFAFGDHDRVKLPLSRAWKSSSTHWAVPSFHRRRIEV